MPHVYTIPPLKETAVEILMIGGFMSFLYFSMDDFLIKTHLFEIFLIWFLFASIITWWIMSVTKIKWTERDIVLYYLFKKHKYLWQDMDNVYYCPKFGKTKLIISTNDGKFYTALGFPNKLYKALERYAPVKIKIIHDPMEVLPYLRERMKNARILKKRKTLKYQEVMDEVWKRE